MNEIRVNLEKTNRLLFEKLKGRDPESLDNLYLLASDYETFREIASHEKGLSDIVLASGRALSNICDDLVKNKSFDELFSAIPSNDFTGKEIIFLAHRGGLCNRLRAICSLKLIADSLETRFNFTWSETLSCKGSIPKCINGITSINNLLFKRINSLSSLLICNDPATPWFFYQKFSTTGKIGSWPEFKERYSNESKRILAAILNALDLDAIYEQFIDKNKLINYTALHIRRTDFVPYFAEKYPTEKLPEVSEYLDYVDNYLQGETFFLSTDDIHVREIFRDRFPDQVCFFNFEFSENELRQTSFSHTLLDLAILSNASKLVVTPHSSFSDYAITSSGAEIIKL